MSPYNDCNYAKIYYFVHTRLTATFLSAQHIHTAKRAHKLNTSPAAPPHLLCQPPLQLPWRDSHNGQLIAVARKWLKSRIFKGFRESRGASWYYVAWRFTVVFISRIAITRVISCYQQGNLWIPTDTAGWKWTSPGTNIFCVSDWTGRPTYAYFVCAWFLWERSLPADTIVVKLFRRGSPLLWYKGVGIASWNYRQKD